MYEKGPVKKYKPTSCHLRCLRAFSWQHPNEVRAEIMRRKRKHSGEDGGAATTQAAAPEENNDSD